MLAVTLNQVQTNSLPGTTGPAKEILLTLADNKKGNRIGKVYDQPIPMQKQTVMNGSLVLIVLAFRAILSSQTVFFLSRFWVSKWQPKILQRHPKFWNSRYGFALYWSSLKRIEESMFSCTWLLQQMAAI